MTENVAGMRVEGAMVVGAAAEQNEARLSRAGVLTAIAALLAALLIGGVAMHDRRANHLTPPTARVVTSQQARFLENNTTNLPEAVSAESIPVVMTSSQQRFLEINTTTLPNAVAANETGSITTRAQQHFWEVNVMLPEGPMYPQAEDMTPLPGHPR